MNLNRKDLLEALRLVAPATKRGQLSITHCVKLDDATGAIQVTATDMDLVISALVGANGILPPTVAPHAPLLAFVDNAGDDLELEVDDDGLHVTSGGSALRLRTRPAEEFPTIRQADGLPIVVNAELAQQIGACLYAASRDASRPVLTGLGIVDGWAVCTDSYRLSAVKLDTALPSAIIPATVVEQVLKATDVGFGLAVDDVRASFLTEHTWTTRLIEGQFPSWTRLVGTPTGALRCERAELLGAIDQVDIFGASWVRLSPDPKGVRLLTRSDDGDEVSAVIDGEISRELAFTLKFLQDIAKAVTGDLFELGLDGPSKPAVIGSLEGGRVDLLMPVRTN